MTMEVTIEQPEAATAEQMDSSKIIDCLAGNETICFKSQQRDESDLTKQQKIDIASDMYNKSKLNFLLRFGKHLGKNQLEFFQQFTENCDDCDEIAIILKNFLEVVKKNDQTNIKNRRYEALKRLIQEDSYFSEIEMMKRNPLLYEQLVGQFLTEEEKGERDRININEEATLVKVLMEGIEREDAQEKRKRQEQDEDSDEDDEPQATYSQWGEFADAPKVRMKKTKTKHITTEEQKLLKEEFVSSMYENFLNGKDEDFDYDGVDNNEKYDNNETDEYDEEDKYFDSEEPATVDQAQLPEESEDELDIFMSGLNQNPAVSQLSKDIQKL